MSNFGYVSLSQASAMERSLNMTAHNLANVNTAGFKAMHPLFESHEDTSGGEGVSYVIDKGAYLDLSGGELVPTGNPLDLGLAGKGWFAFELEGGGTGYSRNGGLLVDVDGRLVNTEGRPIKSPDGAAIILPGDAGSSVAVTPDGVIESQEGEVIGIIGVFTIDQAENMLSLGGGMYRLPDENAPVPQPSESPGIRQGMIEGSNVEAVLEMTRLIDVQRAYENSVKLLTEDDGLTQTAIQRLGQPN